MMLPVGGVLSNDGCQHILSCWCSAVGGDDATLVPQLVESQHKSWDCWHSQVWCRLCLAWQAGIDVSP